MEVDTVLDVRDLKTYFFTDEGIVKAVDGADLSLPRRKTLAVVGESGCGKSVTAFSILQVVGRPGRIVSGEILFHRSNGDAGAAGVEALDLVTFRPDSSEMHAVRGRDIAMIFQEPMTALSPVHTIGDQMIEMIRLHTSMSVSQARDYSVEMLGRVGIPRAETRMDNYTFQLSGGMRQRAMIAIALSCNPSILIADEPTTALDVTTQATILDLMRELQREYGMSMLFITHDLGVVAEIADLVAVMYLGRVVEFGDVRGLFHDPKHPYTQALLRSIPLLEFRSRKRLDAIRGMVPHPFNRPTGCTFHPRCDRFMPGLCDRTAPPRLLLANGREVRCHLYRDIAVREPDRGEERDEL